MAVDLRTYVFLDSLQLQNASFIATVSKGYCPGYRDQPPDRHRPEGDERHTRPADCRACLWAPGGAFRQPGGCAHGR